MAEYNVVLVEPKTPGNIGAVARLMKNFTFKRLILINPVEISEEARTRAMHAQDILEKVQIKYSLEETLKPFDIVVGTSGIRTDKEKIFVRKAESPENFAVETKDYEGSIALVFGREDSGLSNEELNLCDRLIKIPSSKEYPILNLSHAVGIILYEIFKAEGVEEIKIEDPKIDESERERVVRMFSDILDMMDYPEHKKRKTKIMFRRLLGRATTTKWEYHRLMGVLSEIKKYLDKK